MKNSEWIWRSMDFGENEYAEFYDTFEWESDKTEINISVCGDYTLFVNGEYAASNQYADFEHYKVYDNIDITDMLTVGKNRIDILVWYFGKSGMRYLTPIPGLIYEVINNNTVIAKSDEATPSRKSLAYASGDTVHKISPQFGYSFRFDATKVADTDGFTRSCVIQSKKTLFKRPTQKLELKPMRHGKITQNGDRYIVDFGQEFVGLCSFSFVSENVQNINFAFGELLVDGHVKRKIANRDFSFDYFAKQDKNTYTNYMLRLACRYIEIECAHPIDIEYIGIIPQTYPVTDSEMPKLDETGRRIYEICLNTLKLCMLEHYVDCPWREQCLYAFDARNQILAGYYAFDDKNLDYARANLLLMSKDNRDDKLLSICFPSGDDLTIPSFSLFYIIAVNEYMRYSGDLTLGDEVYPKLVSILDAFSQNMSHGLVNKFPGKNHWNYYDWSDYAEGHLDKDDAGGVDFMLNAIVILGLFAFDDICSMLDRPNKFTGIAETIQENARHRFYDSKSGTFFISNADETPTELANAFAIVSRIADDTQKIRIAQKLAQNEFSPCSLSMKTFKYDALLNVDKAKYKNVILSEIRSIYTKMLEAGSTTVWETADGAAAFDNAGSLCHGWSAIPIYYYHILKQ